MKEDGTQSNEKNNGMIETRPTGSGFNSFLRWFKKNEKVRKKQALRQDNSSAQNNQINNTRNDIVSLTSTSNSNFDNRLKSSSCDSILSTDSTGFAFVSPVYYKTYGNDSEATKLLELGSTTDINKKRIKNFDTSLEKDKRLDLTLQQKYKLFEDNEIKLNCSKTEETGKEVKFSDYSLPARKSLDRIEKEQEAGKITDNQATKHRRTASDSSNDRLFGAFVHIKGKKKAPRPPTEVIAKFPQTKPPQTPTSTLGRNKKRQAPQPPRNQAYNIELKSGIISKSRPSSIIIDSQPIYSGLLDDEDIKAFMEPLNSIVDMTKPKKLVKPLTEEQKQLVLENIIKVQIQELDDEIQRLDEFAAPPIIVSHELKKESFSNDTLKLENGMLRPNKEYQTLNTDQQIEKNLTPPPLSPIALRPWYKRPLSGSRESTSIPFKKEVILKTIDKRRNKNKDKENDYPDVGYSRNSIFEAASTKFGIFSTRLSTDLTKSKKIDNQEKRKSGIGIPSISVLDREAADIVHKEHAYVRARIQQENEKYYMTPDQFILGKNNAKDLMNEDESTERHTAKQLISKFNAASNSQKITVNTSYVGRTDLFGELPSKSSSSPKISPKFKKFENELKSREVIDVHGSWVCLLCTLTNPNWRITCEACKQIKPYKKVYESGTPIINAQRIPIKCSQNILTSNEWDKKTEKVRKYFKGQSKFCSGNFLSKSSSETAIGCSNKPTQVPIFGSPKFKRNVVGRHKPDIIQTQISLDDTRTKYLEPLEQNKLEIQSFPGPTNLIPTTAQTADSTINVFLQEEKSLDCSKKYINNEKLRDNRDEIEKEKERLRVMIRKMNAKALTEKYPVQNDNTLTKKDIICTDLIPRIQSEETTRTSNEITKLGAIKKLFTRKDSTTALIQEKINKHTASSDDSILLAMLTQQAQNQLSTYDYANVEKTVNTKEEHFYENCPIYENLKDPKIFTAQEAAELQKIKSQLQSKQGLDEFRATLRSSKKIINNTNTLAINKILRHLEFAIAEGDFISAATHAQSLARLKVSLSVMRQKDRPVLNDMRNEDIKAEENPTEKLTQKIEDNKLRVGEILLEEKQPPFNNQLNVSIEASQLDEASRTSFNLSDDNISFYQTEFDKLVGEVEGAAAFSVTESLKNIPENICCTPNTGWTCPLCTLINPLIQSDCGACSQSRPSNFSIQTEYESLKLRNQKNDLNKSQNPNRKSTEIMNIKTDEIKVLSLSNTPIKTIKDPKSVEFIKGPTIAATNTVMLLVNSPNITRNRYRGVDNFNPKFPLFQHTPTKAVCNTTIKPVEDSIQQTIVKSQKKLLHANHYHELLNLDSTDVVANVDPFDCPVCFIKFGKGDGVILRDCLHIFCRECLRHTIQFSEETEIKCPYMDVEYSCDSYLQDREIKGLVPPNIYEQHLAKSLRQAEHAIENAFHCKTPNCQGWCIFEDDVNEFRCPVCHILNCLTCQAIHDDINCKQYQDRINNGCDSNLEANCTKQMLQDMIDKGEAIKCPICQIILMKKWGCDWLKCSMCKTEICWVTRGRRWGPDGKGDISAGCKCGVNGKKCHVNCNYCH